MRIIELVWAIIGPLLGIVAAWKLFVALLARVNQGKINMSKAFWTYLTTLSFPLLFLVGVGILSAITNMLYMPRKYWMASIWNGDGALGPIILGVGLFVVMIGFNIGFGLSLLFLPEHSRIRKLSQDRR